MGHVEGAHIVTIQPSGDTRGRAEHLRADFRHLGTADQCPGRWAGEEFVARELGMMTGVLVSLPQSRPRTRH
jgi:hypothetical protein